MGVDLLNSRGLGSLSSGAGLMVNLMRSGNVRSMATARAAGAICVTAPDRAVIKARGGTLCGPGRQDGRVEGGRRPRQTNGILACVVLS